MERSSQSARTGAISSRSPADALPSSISETHQAVVVARMRDAVLVDVSDGFCALVGRPREELLGRTAADLGISNRDRLDWLISRFPERGRSHHQQREFETPHGRVLTDMDIHGIEVGGEQLVVAVITPVPDAATRPDERVLGAILEATPLGLVMYDRELRIVRVNRAVERLGRLRPEHIGMRLTDAVPDADPRVPAVIREVFETGEPVVGLEVGRDDDTYLMTLFPIRHGSDEVDNVGCMFMDVTDRVAAERALADSERRRREILGSMLQAEEVERSRIATELHDDTVQVMAAALLGLDRISLVAARTGAGDLTSAVSMARATLEEATERTRRLMFELRPAILHDQGLFRALNVLVSQIAREVGAQGDVSGPSKRYDLAVEELVYRAAQEALANVRKHARPRTIIVSLTDDGETLQSEVRDDGCGFDADSVRSRPDAALHFGLDTMIERIRAAGGDATVESSPGEGTSVRFTVPIRATRVSAGHGLPD
jgi:PAS domain S-box-containing protein